MTGLAIEYQLAADGLARIAGVDEAGRGAWAGPVVSGAVILPLHSANLSQTLRGVRDSKLCTALSRIRLFDKITIEAVAWAVGVASHTEIDGLGIVNATRLSMKRAIDRLTPPPQALIIDALRLDYGELPQRSLPKAERFSLSVAAASIVAKVARDRLMIEADGLYPDYGFARHKGYGTKFHAAALGQYGPSAIHRLSFRPVGGLNLPV